MYDGHSCLSISGTANPLAHDPFLMDRQSCVLAFAEALANS
jgi:hypothetical protein